MRGTIYMHLFTCLLFLLLFPLWACSEEEALIDRAQNGDVAAQLFLSEAYATGKGMPQDDAEAAKWLQLATEHGLANAQFALARMYDLGQGVREDNVEAVGWYRKAAEQGHADAQFELGFAYKSSSFGSLKLKESRRTTRKQQSGCGKLPNRDI